MTFATRLLLLACISVSATSCEWWRETNGPSDTDDSNVVDAHLQFCVSETNRLRATIGRPALARTPSVEAFAQAAAESDHASGQPHGYFQAHAGPGAENEVLRQAIAQNPRDAIQASINGFWGEGPGGPHYESMARLIYTQMGCGYTTSGGLWTVVLEFR